MPARHGAEPGPTPPAAGKSPGVWRARLVAECTQSPGDRRPAGREPRNAELSICPAGAGPLSAGRYKQEARAGPTEGAACGPRGGGCWCPCSPRCPHQQEGVRSPQGDNGLCPVPRPQAASRKDAARTGLPSGPAGTLPPPVQAASPEATFAAISAPALAPEGLAYSLLPCRVSRELRSCFRNFLPPP